MSDLRNRAENIRDERGVSQNTNTRVGQLLVDMITVQESDMRDLLKNLKTKVDGAYVQGGALYLTSGKLTVAGPLNVFPDSEKEQIETALNNKIDGAYVDGNKLYMTAGDVVIVGPLDVGSTDAIDRINDLMNGKVDGAYVESGALYLTAGNDIIAGPLEVGGGSGGGSGVTMKVKATTPTVVSVAEGSAVKLGYNFTSVYTDDNSATGDGVAVLTVNKRTVGNLPAKQGDNEIDVSRYMTPGTNNITLTVSDSAGNTRKLNYSVSVVAIAIKSNFDSSQVFQGLIPFSFIPMGEGEKTVIVMLDGEVAYRQETEASNRQLTCELQTQVHGTHVIEACITAQVGEDVITSNTLHYSIVNVIEGNTAPIIASDWMLDEVEQYNTVAIPFIVYNPVSLTAQVTLKVNGEVVSELEVERTRQVWNYKFSKEGEYALAIASGEVEKQFTVTVTPASVNVVPEASGLELHLTAQGRNNSESAPDAWTNNGVVAAFNGFNFKNDGWRTDSKGSSILRVQAGGQVTIPLKLFGSDFKTTGKTIEFEFATSNVADYEAVLIDCFSAFGLQVTAQQMRFSSESSHVEMYFKEDERIRLSIVVEKRTENRLIYGYVNGVLSAVTQYSLNDNFVQPKPVNVVIGNEKATIDLYNIRVYNHNCR